MSAVNHLKKKAADNQTIGLLICKEKNNVMAQYALESTKEPIGIAEYQLETLLPNRPSAWRTAPSVPPPGRKGR